MNYRSVKQILPAFKVDMGGVVLDQALPHSTVKQIDPFLLLHHLNTSYPAGSKQQEVGVPPHPHRGFAPVTFIFQGGVHHRDSMNISSVVHGGGTQWMHAGKGIVHSERPTKEVAEQGSTWELIQFWVNLPAKYKMSAPQYHPLSHEDTPLVTSADGRVKLGVVAGDFQEVQGGIETYSPILALRMNFEAEGQIDIPIPEGFNAFVYLLDGQLAVNGQSEVKEKDLVWLAKDGAGVHLKAKAATRAILLAGEPINEPLVSYGPFVMNKQSEIMEAMQDFQSGKMGHLEEVFD
ncbi:MAG: pirin family protein [Bacteroidota bacterium]